MSGYLAIINFDGAPVEPDLLKEMTESLHFRGPHAQRTLLDRCAGFGHTLLRSTFEAEHEIQPFSSNGYTWIVADARIDAREELVAKLKAKGLPASIALPDVELVLQAFHAWGTSCVDYLLGDFSFCIWDANKKKVFCGRDHLGIKSFFYSQINQTLIISNTLDCIRRHPAITNTLNEQAVADFLLSGCNYEKDTSIYADIQRLPPAHVASWVEARKTIYKYWSLPIDEPIHYRHPQNYLERFHELLDTAVADRLRTPKLGVFMSGGLDSTTLAARSSSLLSNSGAINDTPNVCAFTISLPGYDGNEVFYASLAADFLGIPIVIEDKHYTNMNSDWYSNCVHTPEPVTDPYHFLHKRALMQRKAGFSPVAFYGEGPDNALRYEWSPYLRFMFRQRKLPRLFRDIIFHASEHRNIPLIAAFIRGKLLRRQHRASHLDYPQWINPDFESRLRLRERWDEIHSDNTHRHPVRPSGHASFEIPQWQALFDSLDASSSLCPLEVRYPFLDLRLLRFLLAVPAVPWCRRKLLIRKAMYGKLPEAVLRRAKTPVYRDPTEQVPPPQAPMTQAPIVQRFVTNMAISPEPYPKSYNSNLANFWSFNYWLLSRNL